MDMAQEFPLNPRQKLLDEARKITSNDRNKTYGGPEDNFRNIAAIWNAYFAARNIYPGITAFDVAQMMILMKAVRLATNPTHRDSLVDQAGYAACGADCQEHMLRMNPGKLTDAGLQGAAKNEVTKSNYDHTFNQSNKNQRTY